MGNVLVEEQSLQDIADAIREVTSTEDKLKPSEMGNAQRNFANGLINQANATTGNKDTDLASAVGSLVEGYGHGSEEDYFSVFLMDMLETYSNSKITSVKNSAFYMSSIKTLSLPNVETSESYSFSCCKQLVTVDLPKLNSANGSHSFSNCIMLEEIKLPELMKAGANCFGDCSNLKKINLPKLKEIANSTFFNNCRQLNVLILGNDTLVPIYATSVFTNTPIANGTGYIYVPKVLIEEYKVATNWSTFADQFRAIEDYPEICGGETE